MNMDMPGDFFSVGPFMPHGGCYLWTQSLIALHTLSDGAIFLSYYSIPVILLYFVRSRPDLKFKWIFICFAAFVLACGTTHFMEIWNVWHADYWLSGFIKAVTATVSVSTTILLVKLLPTAIALPSAEDLRKAHAELEIRVQERTAELRRTERALRTISDCNQKLVRATTESALLQAICGTIVESGGYRMACVGFAENDAGKSIRIAAHAGFDEGYLQQLQVTWADTERGRGPLGTAVRTGQMAVCHDTQIDPQFAPWRAAAIWHGFASLIALPLLNGSTTFGVLGLYAGESHAFTPAEIELLQEMAADLAYGIQSLRLRAEHQQAEAELGRKVAELAALNALGRLVNASLKLEETSQAALAGMIEAVHPDLAFLFLREDGRLIFQAALPAAGRQRLGDFPEHRVGECMCGLAVREKKPLYARDILTDCRCTWDECKRAGFKSFAALPLTSGEEVFGVIGLASETERDFARESGFLETLASQIAGALVKTRLHETVRKELAERQQVEEKLRAALTEADRFRAAMDQVQACVFLKDVQSRLTYANQPTLDLFGCSAGELIGQDDRRFFPPETLQRLREIDARVFQGEQTNEEVEIRDAHGRRRIFWEVKTPIYADAGRQNVCGLLGISTDITERRQLEKQLLQTQKMEAIGRLAGGIAHDFNNILAAMLGYTFILQQDTEGNAAAQESLAEILKATDRAKDLVQQILTFSRQREQKREVIQLDTVVKEATKFLRASLPANLIMEIQLDPDAPAVLADPTQIYQVIINLATNAQHAMEEHPGRLTVRLAAFLPDPPFRQRHPGFRPIPYARLTVTDTGQGMDASTLEHIFEPFFTTKQIGKGTGLGLSVVHGIVQSHEGIVLVESQAGQGATFNLYFPAQTQGTPLADGRPVKICPGQGQEILVVDDEPTLTAILKSLLVRLNYQVVTCNQPRAAISLLSENSQRFALVITDLTMPEMNGMELAREVHQLRPEMPIIITSGFSSVPDDAAMKSAGVCGLLKKPASLAELAETVQRALLHA